MRALSFDQTQGAGADLPACDVVEPSAGAEAPTGGAAHEEGTGQVLRVRTPNDLNTPPIILDALAPLGPIVLDPCSNPWSIVPAAFHLDGSPGRDGLEHSWWELAGRGLVFVNPPYGRGHMPLWAEKIAREAEAGCEIVALVKGDFSTRWWRALRGQAKAIGYVSERVAFLGGEHGSGNFASALIYLGPRPFLFAHAVGSIADVRVL